MSKSKQKESRRDRLLSSKGGLVFLLGEERSAQRPHPIDVRAPREARVHHVVSVQVVHVCDVQDGGIKRRELKLPRRHLIVLFVGETHAA